LGAMVGPVAGAARANGVAATRGAGAADGGADRPYRKRLYEVRDR
jgi:hypothetical protein